MSISDGMHKYRFEGGKEGLHQVCEENKLEQSAYDRCCEGAGGEGHMYVIKVYSSPELNTVDIFDYPLLAVWPSRAIGLILGFTPH